MAEDPYFALKDEVELNVGNAEKLFNQWKDLLNGPDTSAAGQSFRRDTDILKELLSDIDEDLEALQETISVVEANPARFRLDVREIQERKNFVARTRKAVADIRKAVLHPSKSPERDAVLQGPKSIKDSRFTEDSQPSNQRFIERETQQQQLLFQQQDHQLDGVLDTVGNLKEIAHVMGREMDDQTGLLVDLEAGVDTTAGKLQLGLRRMQEFIKANADTKQQWTIIILIVILIILVIMIIMI
ncbi:syntaxin 6, N-terminal-domain-containing protein [Phlyctochytrium arcticum]|nr:syntaxin 6, N-terminal-domain-containing protein [Phlyctochytrium arcticum]